MDEQIRSGRDSDSAGIAALVRQLALEERGVGTDDAAVERAVRLCVQGSGRDVLVAEVQGTIVGYVVVHWVPFPMLGGVEGYISDLIVASARRGAGLGSRLIDQVETLARHKACVRLMLNNRVASESFRRAFYPKRGYRRRDEFANLVKVLR